MGKSSGGKCGERNGKLPFPFTSRTLQTKREKLASIRNRKAVLTLFKSATYGPSRERLGHG